MERKRSEGWKRVWNSHWRTAAFAVAGAVAGVAYFQLVGCRAGGTCALTSSPWRTAAFFAAAAAVAGFPARSPEAGPGKGRPG
jgi:hypothetical protein